MARTRLMVTMHKGNPHVVDFDGEEAASAALKELVDAMGVRASLDKATTIANRLVVRPSDVRSAELVEPPRGPFVG